MRYLILSLALGCGGDEGSEQTTLTETGTTNETETNSQVWGQDALDHVIAKAGTYHGAWEMYGLDASDKVYLASTWTDIAVGSNPRIEGDRAQLDVIDTMDIDGFEYVIEWTEGLMIEKDGSTGQAFMDMDGVVTLMPEIKPGYFQYQTDVVSSDLFYMANIDMSNLILGYHVTEKWVSEVNGLETHDITRNTHLKWSDKSGEYEADFLSMTGQHTKVK